MAKIFPSKILPRRVGLRTGGPFSGLGSFFQTPNWHSAGPPPALYIYYIQRGHQDQQDRRGNLFCLSICPSVTRARVRRRPNYLVCQTGHAELDNST